LKTGSATRPVPPRGDGRRPALDHHVRAETSLVNGVEGKGDGPHDDEDA
jgi:hypothetical protein